MAEMLDESLCETGYQVRRVAGAVAECVALAEFISPIPLFDLRPSNGGLGAEVAEPGAILAIRSDVRRCALSTKISIIGDGETFVLPLNGGNQLHVRPTSKIHEGSIAKRALGVVVPGGIRFAAPATALH